MKNNINIKIENGNIYYDQKSKTIMFGDDGFTVSFMLEKRKEPLSSIEEVDMEDLNLEWLLHQLFESYGADIIEEINVVSIQNTPVKWKKIWRDWYNKLDRDLDIQDVDDYAEYSEEYAEDEDDTDSYSTREYLERVHDDSVAIDKLVEEEEK